MNIEDLLEKLRPYAHISIFQYDDETWSAKASLRIRAEGGKFEIESGYKHRSCKAACEVLLQRVLAVVNQASDLKRLGSDD